MLHLLKAGLSGWQQIKKKNISGCLFVPLCTLANILSLIVYLLGSTRVYLALYLTQSSALWAGCKCNFAFRPTVPVYLFISRAPCQTLLDFISNGNIIIRIPVSVTYHALCHLFADPHSGWQSFRRSETFRKLGFPLPAVCEIQFYLLVSMHIQSANL